MGAVAPASSHLQNMLQKAVQTVQWTYSLYWQLCPQERILIWGDGYYNGAIKTRKTLQPMEETAEEASLERSQQLRELYDFLSAEETNQQQTRRPSAALSPEDLTESEWFYLMCISFSFPPGVGLPGKAYAKRQLVWLTGANEVDTKLFTRAILAKSASIQTVVCIPLVDGVVELGTVEKVEKDLGLVQHMKSIFGEHQPPKPALSMHSSSNSGQRFQSSTTTNAHHENSHQIEEEDGKEEEEEEEEEEDDSDSNTDTVRRNNSTSRFGVLPIHNAMPQINQTAEPSELMQLDFSEDIRLGSPDDDASHNLDSDNHLHPTAETGNPQTKPGLGALYRSESIDPPPSSTGVPSFSREDTHYSRTVSTILPHQSSRWSETSSGLAGYVTRSTLSAFSKWSAAANHGSIHGGSSQSKLKYILFTVPLLHSKSRDKISPKSCELNGNHVLAERRRREKLNERFMILRSLLPLITKIDKASILGDAIEYVKQLRNKIQELEARTRQLEGDQRSKIDGDLKKIVKKKKNDGVDGRGLDKRKMRIVEEGSGGGNPKAVESPPPPPPAGVEEGVLLVEVSIIESDALVELRCPHREGLLLDVMQMLRELRLEITAVQSSLNNGIFVAELRAKVKKAVNGKRVTILEVKKAIHQIIPHYSL